MLKVLLFGVVCAVMAAILIFLGAAMGLQLPNVLYGIAAGAVLGLQRTQSPLGRAGAFLIGFLFGLLYFVVTATVLPATAAGSAVATVVIILILTLIAMLTRDRLPLWGMFLGAMTYIGVYWAAYNATPWFLPTQSVQLAGAVLLPAAAGFLICLLVEIRELKGHGTLEDVMAPDRPAPEPVAAGTAPAAPSTSVLPGQGNPPSSTGQ